FLILLHLISVALLASFRTGLQLALWHSLLLLVVHYAQQSRLLEPLPAAAGVGTPFQQLLAFSAVFWFVALVTASFSAVNERELRRRRYELEALARMAARLDGATDAHEVADIMAGAVAETFDFRRAVLRRVVSMAERFASHGTLALRNAWLLADARRRAATDGLTGLANRPTFDAVLGQELERAARGDDHVSLVLMDLDHFKRVNDEHGHQAGDDVLRRVAATLAARSRVYDTAARYGGA